MGRAKKYRGRPGILTAELQDSIVQHLRMGNYKRHAALASGISYGAFTKWQRRGSEELDRRDAGEKARRAEQIYVEFVLACEKAQAEAVTTAVTTIRRGMLTDWRAAKAWLEGKRGTGYNRPVDMANPSVGSRPEDEKDPDNLTDDQLKRIARKGLDKP